MPGEPLSALDEPASLQAENPSDRTGALAVLDSMQRGAFEGAFERLGRYAFTRRVRTEQLAGQGEVTAFEERVVRYGFSGGERVQEVRRRDSSGTFDFGLVGRFVSAENEPGFPEDLAPHLFPEDPPYLSPRSRALYAYRLRPDTLWADRTTRVVDMVAGAEARQNRPLRRARFYVDAATRQLVGFHLERLSQTLLFDEASRLFLRLEPAPDSGWVPAEVRAQVQTRFPLSAAQQMRTTSAFTEYTVP